jgi:transcriptional regulator NrdR family protein
MIEDDPEPEETPTLSVPIPRMADETSEIIPSGPEIRLPIRLIEGDYISLLNNPKSQQQMLSTLIQTVAYYCTQFKFHSYASIYRNFDAAMAFHVYLSNTLNRAERIALFSSMAKCYMTKRPVEFYFVKSFSGKDTWGTQYLLKYYSLSGKKLIEWITAKGSISQQLEKVLLEISTKVEITATTEITKTKDTALQFMERLATVSGCFAYNMVKCSLTQREEFRRRFYDLELTRIVLKPIE